MKSIILVGGFWDNALTFRKLKRAFQEDFPIYEFWPAYRQKNTAELAEDLRAFIQKYHLDDYAIIAHSYGGVLVRYFLTRYAIQNKKVILIGTPNNGSSLLTLLVETFPRLLKFIFGEPCLELAKNPLSVLKHPAHCEITVIAGNQSFDWRRPESYLIPLFWNVTDSDGKLKIAEASYKAAAATKIIHAYHTFLANDPKTTSFIENFLAAE